MNEIKKEKKRKNTKVIVHVRIDIAYRLVGLHGIRYNMRAASAEHITRV